jgi:hypothetical protein
MLSTTIQYVRFCHLIQNQANLIRGATICLVGLFLFLSMCSCERVFGQEDAPAQEAPAQETPPASQPEFIDLFDGKTLEGWVQRGGTADYVVEEGVIVGRTRLGTPNSFLCTSKEFSDFELELEFRVDSERVNSGIQIRSESKSEYKDGRVHGYQVEIDPSPRAWTGGIYDESRRGWLVTLKDNPEAQGAFKLGAWNRFKIIAQGDKIKTWINDVPAADLLDNKTLKGFIALQVHSTNEAMPKEVRWRNIRIKEMTDARPQ